MGGTTAAKRAYKQRHRAAGLCVSCQGVATHGMYCRQHWKWFKAFKNAWYKKYAAAITLEGKCVHCGAKLDPDSDGTARICINCTDKQRARPERKGGYK